MQRHIRILLPAAGMLLLLASCHSVPKHARFIPADALMVVGVHTGEMRKELAWSAITGSNLLDELRKSGAGDQAPAMLKDLEHSGIDFGSTLYFYSRQDNRFGNGTRLAAVLPVSDAGKISDYFRKHAPGVAIRKVKDRSEALIDEQIFPGLVGRQVYIGWNDDALIAMNPIVRKVSHQVPAGVDTIGGVAVQGQAFDRIEEIADPAATAAEMDAAFHPAKKAGMDRNSRFRELEREDHDLTMFVAYDALMESYAGSRSMGMMGASMGRTLWKGSAMTAGFDFEKGRLDGRMRYYASDSMRPVAKEFGKEDIDPEMLRRLPAGGLNFAAGYHIEPKAIRLMLDKMGLSGIANLALIQKGLSVDDILGAFSGDMVVSLNNFRVETRMQEIDSATRRDYGLTPQPVNSTNMDYVFAVKIGDKSRMARLLNFTTMSKLLVQTAPDTYRLPNAGDGPTLVMSEKYVAISASERSAQAFLRDASGKMPEAVKKEISGHPAGMWADVRSFMAGAGSYAGRSPGDAATLGAIGNMFTTFTAKGGEYKGNATEYELSLGFANKAESSLVQLLHLAQQLAAARNSKAVAYR